MGPAQLVRRYLPPGCYADLYHLYVSFQRSQDMNVASPTTFYRVLKETGWRKVLKFRPESSHSACTVCQRLKAKLKHAKDINTHAKNADLLMRHLQGQFLDRSTYWSARTHAKRDMDILTIITDSMDRGKFLLPKYQGGRTPKDLVKYIRPSCEVTASLVHGRLIYVAIADEGEATGSSWVLEVVNRSLNLGIHSGPTERVSMASHPQSVC